MLEFYVSLLLVVAILIFSYLYLDRLAFTWTPEERRRMAEEKLYLYMIIEAVTAPDLETIFSSSRGRKLSQELSGGFWQDLKKLLSRNPLDFGSVAIAALLALSLSLIRLKWFLRWYTAGDIRLLAGLELALFRRLN